MRTDATLEDYANDLIKAEKKIKDLGLICNIYYDALLKLSKGNRSPGVKAIAQDALHKANQIK